MRIYCGANGKAWKDSRFTIYGWIEPGGNISTSNLGFNKLSGTGGNYPAAYSYEPDTIQLDQAALYFERTPDEIQRDHFDWGFRVATLYGTDYKYTFSNGILSYQYTEQERLYGFDPVMYYLDFYFPNFFDGENLRVGRYISIPDIEAQLAPEQHHLQPFAAVHLRPLHAERHRLDHDARQELEGSAGAFHRQRHLAHRQAFPPAHPCSVHDLHDRFGARCALPVHERAQQPEFRLEQRSARRRHVVSQDQRAMARRYRGLVHVAKSHAGCIRIRRAAAILAAMFPAPEYNIGAPSGAQCNNRALVYCASHEWAMVNYLNYTSMIRTTLDLAERLFQRQHRPAHRLQRLLCRVRSWLHPLGRRRARIAPGGTLRTPGIRAECGRNRVRVRQSVLRAGGAGGPTCTFSSGGRTLSFQQNGGKRSQAMLAVDAIFHF